MWCLKLLVAHGMWVVAFEAQMWPMSATVRLELAPREALLDEFERLAEGNTAIGLDVVASSTYIESLLSEGDLERYELESMFNAVAASSAIGPEAFVNLCEQIDDLYEDDELQDQQVGDSAETKERVVARVLSLLPSSGCFLRSDYESADAIATTLEQGFGDATDLSITAEAIKGNWQLAYASSPAFHFNGGLTGVAKTTPGGADFVGLAHSLDEVQGAGVSRLVETLRPKTVGDHFQVVVNADWQLKRQLDPLTRSDKLILDLKPRSVKYGLVDVDGDRVEKGWKTMRVVTSLTLIHLDSNLRIQRGTTPNAWFVWRRV